MFQVSDYALVNKMDIAEVLGTDIPLIYQNIQSIQKESKILEVSAKCGDGLDQFKNELLQDLGLSKIAV